MCIFMEIKSKIQKREIRSRMASAYTRVQTKHKIEPNSRILPSNKLGRSEKRLSYWCLCYEYWNSSEKRCDNEDLPSSEHITFSSKILKSWQLQQYQLTVNNPDT